MIKLNRVRTASAIPKGLRGKTRITRAAMLLANFRDNKKEFKAAFWKAAKDQLRAETGGKCAYCEAPTDTVAHGDVEHFRPKDLYWWLAYCYDNYLFSCQVCNQSFKGNSFPTSADRLAPDPPLPNPFPAGLPDEQFAALAAHLAPDPLHDNEGMPLAAFVAAAVAEGPSLIDPYIVDPAQVLAWEADSVLKEVRAVPRDQQPPTLQRFADLTTGLGLNREELCRTRWERFAILRQVRDGLELSGLTPEVRALFVAIVQQMMDVQAPYAGMSRYFVHEAWHLDLT